MSYLDDYKAYLVKNGVANAYDLPEPEISRLMGEKLRAGDRSRDEDLYVPTKEEYDNSYDVIQKKREEWKLTYESMAGESESADPIYIRNVTERVLLFALDEENAKEARKPLNELVEANRLNSEEDALNFIAARYQLAATRYKSWEPLKKDGYKDHDGPKMTKEEKQLLLEKAKLAKNPPEKPGILKRIVHYFFKDQFKEVEEYDRFASIDQRIADAHRRAATVLGEEHINGPAARRQPVQQAEQPQVQEKPVQQPEIVENKASEKERVKSLLENPESGNQVLNLLNNMGKQPQNDVIQPQNNEILENLIQNPPQEQPQVQEKPVQFWKEYVPAYLYLDDWQESAEILQENVRPGQKNESKLAEMGIKAVKNIKYYLDPKNPMPGKDEHMELDESICALGVYQLYGTPVDSGGLYRLSPLNDDAFRKLNKLGDVNDMLPLAQEYGKAMKKDLTLDGLKKKLERNETVFDNDDKEKLFGAAETVKAMKKTIKQAVLEMLENPKKVQEPLQKQKKPDPLQKK